MTGRLHRPAPAATVAPDSGRRPEGASSVRGRGLAGTPKRQPILQKIGSVIRLQRIAWQPVQPPVSPLCDAVTNFCGHPVLAATISYQIGVIHEAQTFAQTFYIVNIRILGQWGSQPL